MLKNGKTLANLTIGLLLPDWLIIIIIIIIITTIIIILKNEILIVWIILIKINDFNGKG